MTFGAIEPFVSIFLNLHLYLLTRERPHYHDFADSATDVGEFSWELVQEERDNVK